MIGLGELSFVFDLPLLLAGGFIGGIIKKVAGKLFGGGSSGKSKSTSGPSPQALEASDMLLDLIKRSGGLKTGEEMLGAMGPSFSDQLAAAAPDMNWYSALMGSPSRPADGTTLNSAFGDGGRGAFSDLMATAAPQPQPQPGVNMPAPGSGAPGSGIFAELMSRYSR